jgi:hypothetical protein
MNANAMIASASCATAVGLSAGLMFRLAPAWLDLRRATMRGRNVLAALENEENEGASGQLRNSSIVGLCGNALRHADGSFTRAFHVALAPTVLSDDLTIENRCDALARMLAARKPIGTILQFRLSVGVDPGLALMRHHTARDAMHVHPAAALLLEGGLQHYAALAGAGLFRQTVLTCWVRVPNPKRRVEDLFLPTLRREVRQRGWRHLPNALARSWHAASAEQVVRRWQGEEEEALAAAEKTFRQIERECPLTLTPFTREELWAATFLSHRQNATSVPMLPYDGTDLRAYLCGETIEASGHYVLHGAYRAALISLFTPPQPAVTADALRLLCVNNALNFRQTIISEFVYPDQRKGMKRLDRSISQVSRSANRLTGKQKLAPEARVALDDLAHLCRDLAGGRAALTQLRFSVLVYGPPARTRTELAAALKDLDRHCEQVVSELRKIAGADAEHEEPAALRVLYQKSLIGETEPRANGREITETAHSLAPLIPTESEWLGAPRPHTLFSLPTGKLIGFDLFDRQLIPSPLALALAAPRGGKSVLLARLICDVLASKASACIRAVDFGASFAPLVDVLGGRHLRFEVGTKRTINVWDYEGLEQGVLPDEVQVGFVVGDLLQLARVPAHDSLAEDLLTTLVNEVYRNEVPRNQGSGIKHEPQLAHLYDLLGTWPFKGAAANRAEELKLALGQFVGHSFLDAPTHRDFAGASALDVYELDSLEQFPERVRESLAYRAAARVLRAIGKLNEDGTRARTLLVFDEVWKIREKYPRILDVIKRGARTGGKENVVTLLATQAYEDLSSLPGIARTAGVRIIGKQIDDYSPLVADCGLSLQAAAAISVIHNVPGSHAQFLLVLGSGEDKIVQTVQCDLSPVELWTFTTNPDERNARARVQTLRPAWTLAEVIRWLAMHYPQGLTGAGLVQFDEALLV